MEPKLDYIRKLVREHNWSGSELARRMGVSRSEANRFLNGERKGGNKLIGGLLKAFPEESLEKLFILPTMYPNGNILGNDDTFRKPITESILRPPPTSIERNDVMKPVRHPSAHHIACTINEATGTIEIVDGNNITTLIVPIGPIEVRHTKKL